MKSSKYLLYLKRIKRRNILVISVQIFLFLMFIFIWEMLSYYRVINTFITSSPRRIIQTIILLLEQHNLWKHIWITVFETGVSFLLGTFLGILIAVILWIKPFIARVVDPYLTVFNSLPKVSLGPILIIWIGANTGSIIVMALLISLIVTVISVYNGFISTDNEKIKLLKSFHASRKQILYYLVLPYNYRTIISSLKINISMSLIGVIMGELLVSKGGIGYLIMYGSQVFNLDLVMTGIVILMIVSYVMYFVVSYLEKILIKY